MSVAIVSSWTTVAPAAAGIEYQGALGCPTAGDFVARVRQRIGDSAAVAGTEGEPRFEVDIQNLGAQSVGRVRRVSRGAPSEAREVSGASCDQVADALALSIALSIVSGQAPPAPPTPVSAAPATAPTTWVLGAGAGVLGLFPPRPMATAALFVENLRHSRGRGPAFFRPDARIVFQHARNDVLASPEAARFSITSVSLDFCPVGAELGAGLALRLCGGGQAGLLTGVGLDVATPQSARVFWRALGTRARLRWTPSPHTTVELEGGAMVPLLKRDFVFQMPRVVVASLPDLVWSVGIAGGVSIP